MMNTDNIIYIIILYQKVCKSSNDNNLPFFCSQVVILPDVRSTSTYYASQTAQFQQDIIEPCLPRQLSNNPPRLECQEVSFTLSTEFYSQAVLRKMTNML